MPELSTFENFASLQRGFDLPLQDRQHGKFPIISSAGHSGTHSVFMVKGPGVVTGRSGTIGLVHYNEGDFWPLNTTLYVKDFKGNVPRYVALVLENMNLKLHAAGTTVPSLNRNVLANVPVWIPLLDEQRRIVDLIGTVDTAIESAETKQLNLEALNIRSLEAAYSRIVGTPAPLVSVFDHIIGGSWGSPPGTEDIDVVAIGPSAYSGGRTKVDPSLGSLRSLSAKRAAVRTLQAGDVVLERSGGSPTQPVGRVLRACDLPSKVVPSDFMRLLRPDVTKVSPSYVFWVMWLLYKQGAPVPFQKFTTGIRNLNIPQYLEHVTITIPTALNDRADFCNLAETFLSLSDEQDSHIQSLRVLRTELLAALLSGAHRIPRTYDELTGA